VVWLLLTITGAAGLLWSQHNSREAALAQRFQLRVGLMGDFVTSYVADLIARERSQAEAFLADPVVAGPDFSRSVAGFGYSSAVLLDARGQVLQVLPANPALIGTELAGRYAHLSIAMVEDRPAVSSVVPSAARGVPVVAFAVPFDTTSGRRVFSGAVEVAHSPLSSYLSTALSLSGVRVQLVDASGAIVAANRTHEVDVPTLATDDPALATALREGAQGRYPRNGHWWRYSAQAIPGTPWQLSATVPEDVLFASAAGNELAGRAGLGTAAVVGLLVVGAVARGRRSRRDLGLSEQRFRRVFENSRTGMILTDPTGRLVRVNPAVCQMLGRPERDLLGKHVIDITHPDDAGIGAERIRDCVAGRIDGFDIDKRYLRADGRVVEASVTTALLRDESGRPQYFATQILDVTERRALARNRRRHEVELAERAEQLQQANAQMTDFIAMLTHDVRQPLTNVVAAGELVLEDWADLPEDTKQHYVRRMTASGHRASQLVGEILTLAQLDAGALVARPVRLDVAHAVREAVAAQGMSPDAVTVVAPDECTALADPAHLPLILGNLLGNADKYGAAPVTVTVINATEHVRIHVSDLGEGVPAAFVGRLFDRFSRADSGVATSKPGTGLGLYLAQQLARASGLAIGYQPNEPRGATFTLTLPRTPNRPAHVERRHSVAAGAR
jgi:PAS domain S-box-containing protein